MMMVLVITMMMVLIINLLIMLLTPFLAMSMYDPWKKMIIIIISC